MSQRIALVLQRISKSACSDPTTKPGVVLLYGTAAVASKMIGIVEVVKREVQKKGERWWQYCKLEGKLQEWKLKKESGGMRGNARGDGKKEERRTTMRKDQSAEENVITVSGESATPEMMDVDGDEDLDEAFETMVLPRRADAQGGKNKIRNVPMMTIYIAQVPVPGLKALYGEQTNA
ncbi:MAG: hypothetical protein Q9163_005477 [Psora crenata]